MKASCIIILSVVAIGSLNAPAQTAPKLALAGVSVAPILAKEYHSSKPIDGAAPVQPADLLGIWNGDTHNNGKANPFILTITKAADGSVHADFKNVVHRNSFHSTSVSCEGSNITITFGAGEKSHLLYGDLDANHSVLSMKWDNTINKAAITLQRAQMLSNPKPSPETAPLPDDLVSISHTLDVQLADSFEAAQMFAVMEGNELVSAIPPEGNGPYNLKDLETAARFKRAGINYLLVTSLEDFKNDTVDEAQGTVAYKTAIANFQASGSRSRSEKNVEVSGTVVKMQGKYAPHRVIEQVVYLTVRCRLFDVATGDLVDSANYSFSTNRTYVALAQGDDEVSVVDLFEAAARNVSTWAVNRELESVFPITVLEKSGNEITINRGSDSGVSMGQIYDIYTTGKEIKDPTTGDVLGHDEVAVGRVTVSELQPKFSKARIWEDTGITSGAVLRLATYN